ncbi:MAG TPA: formimidoylglutamase [Thermoanaerobaculaceae bacterium]|nr:formimidoylglutamase [Thermoanaerobaculaceae bacterium]
MDIWTQLGAVDGEVFYSRHDPNDIRLGDIVLRDPADYERSDVVVVGCPQDQGVRRNRGRTGARRAPAEIRKALYRYAVSEAHAHLRLFDAGDIRISRRLETTHDLLTKVLRQILADGKKAVVLGGGNDISYPDCCALSVVARDPLVINIDRHLDVRADTPRNSGTPYRQLLEEGRVRPDLFHEVGINSFNNSSVYMRWVEQIGAHIHLLGDLRRAGVGATVRAITEKADADAIFFGFDLDVVHAAEAPGVSDPSPMGLTAMEVCEIADVAASDSRTRVIEVTEVNPVYDPGGVTAKLAANIIVRALAGTPGRRGRAG